MKGEEGKEGEEEGHLLYTHIQYVCTYIHMYIHIHTQVRTSARRLAVLMEVLFCSP